MGWGPAEPLPPSAVAQNHGLEQGGDCYTVYTTGPGGVTHALHCQLCLGIDYKSLFNLEARKRGSSSNEVMLCPSDTL